MQYKSTRDSSIRYSSAQAIAQGISREGGLFVPESIPAVGNRLGELAKLDYMGRAVEIFKLFLTDYSEAELVQCVKDAYAPQKFENNGPAPLKNLPDGSSMLELWHGPTCAFKDMALQILPHLLTKALKKTGENKEAVILVATSGDTGKAALDGFRDVEGTKLIVFYPDSGVSPMQLRQMLTQEGENVYVCAVKGNFDDCQTQVKRIFTDSDILKRLSDKGMTFSSANSINWGRLLPQIIYYFSAYLDLYNSGEINSLSERLNFVVPTGNFGNILAAYYAGRMGLPINKLICASNSNNVLTDFIRSGSYNKNRDFYTTISPSMDILVSSNLERLLFHLCKEDSHKLKSWMDGLGSNGGYTVDEDTAKAVKELFWAGSCTDEETLKTIGESFKACGYLLDPHTAVASKVYADYKQQTGDSSKTVIVSTASPYKFAASVLGGIAGTEAADEFEMVEKLRAVSGLPVPKSIADLQEKPLRFNNCVDRDTIMDFVIKSLNI